MTHSEHEQMAAMEREPALAAKLIDEMDRSGRDYMRLREVEARCETLAAMGVGAQCHAQALADVAEWKRRAEAAEAQLAEVTALYDKYGEHIQGCSAYVEMYSCDCGFIEANAAREKGGK